MGKLEFNGCKLKVQLEAQSPIIHFQHDQAGATLRASEVKPKLDRFLLNKMEQETGKRVAVLKEDNGYAVMFTDKEHNALNYRMNFEVPGNAYWVEPGTFKPESYSIYYGNSGVHDEKEKKKAVFTNPVMNLMCFNQVLRNYIEKYLAEKELELTATLDAAAAYRDADFVVIAAPTNYDPVKNYFDNPEN